MPGVKAVSKYEVGDIVRLKKLHPCGGDEWEIMRTGVDFRLRCRRCGRVMMLPRPKFERSVRRKPDPAD